jgi:hypothetical protein
MESNTALSDERKIYLATKAVHVYKHFREKYPRATNLVNQDMGVGDDYPPMIRVSSVEMWRKWKKLVVLLEEWDIKDGIGASKIKILLRTCIVVLRMMIDNEEKTSRTTNKEVDTSEC